MSATEGAACAQNSAPPMTTRSVSDHMLKTSTNLDDSVVTRLNGSNGLYEPMAVWNGRRMPSYVGISCAISGYSDYNRYCSSVRNNCARRDISVAIKEVTHRPVNHLSDSLNRKNSLIGEALITSRHNVNEDVEVNGSHQSINYDNNTISESDGKDNSLLERRIASLYGQNFANDWRESRTRTRTKMNSSCIVGKHRSPSCPPIPKPSTKLVANTDRPSDDNAVDTHSNPISDRQSVCSERLATTTSSEAIALNAVITANDVSDNKPMAQSISNHENGSKSEPNSLDGSDGSQNAQSKLSTARDGKWFLDELNKTTDEIKCKIDLTEELLRKEADSMTDEIAGKLRAAVGKANLLINKKFNQFRQLCLKNISQPESEQFVTTNDDLEGFWDMVSIQVIDISDTFDEISKLRDIGWKKELLPKKATQTPSKVRSRKSTPKGSPDKSCDESTADRDSERRNRLKEAKRRARLKASQTEDEITIFIPSTKE